MKNLRQTRFLLISKSARFKQLIRENLHLIGSIFSCNTTTSAKEYVDTETFSAIIIDQDIQFQNSRDYNLLLFSVCQKNLSDSVIIFCEEISQEQIYLYYRYRINNIFFLSSINLFLEPTVKKILSLIPETNDMILRDRGISLYLSDNYAIYRGCRILLSNTEKLILNYLLKKCSLCTKEELVIYLSNILQREIPVGYLTVNISRLRRKFIKHTGINIVKSRNGFGYYLSV
ncbi:MAG: hypothetical protein UR73_C0008G0003 [candidate division WS6 bacterium GW2011_GWF1_35_23]|uniref:OmpR/PhoB-type domain-containing protein n=1 Tax=candidate division WS6 bacterium GW2011_GWF1_35_23 TaxID=1619097 RepID=A0A0G0FEC1_9BACT|nr:MAG: hypothetical protein UR73_C0008G0003 [candidate division WS6 bacterium GW2011_GWF1_35_23]